MNAALLGAVDCHFLMDTFSFTGTVDQFNHITKLPKTSENSKNKKQFCTTSLDFSFYPSSSSSSSFSSPSPSMQSLTDIPELVPTTPIYEKKSLENPVDNSNNDSFIYSSSEQQSTKTVQEKTQKMPR